MSAVLTDRQDGVLLMTLNRPDAHNSLNASVFAELMAALEAAERDSRVRVILTRASGRSFSVGADAGNLDGYSSRGMAETFDEDFAGKVGLHTGAAGLLEDLGMGRWALAAAAIQKPMIASIQGVAAGGGFALAMLHHFRIGSRQARFTAAFGKLGLGPELGLSATLPAVVGRQAAMDIILSSRVVDAEEAHRIGVLDRLTAPEALEHDSLRFADELAQLAPLAARAALRQLTRPLLKDLREQLEVEWRDQTQLFSSQDFREGVAAFAERRPPIFQGR